MDGDDSKDAADSSILWLREIEQTDGEEGGGTEREGNQGRGRKGARSERENEREREVRSNNVRAKASTAFPCEGADRKG